MESSSKGRPTPSRREAQQARKAERKPSNKKRGRNSVTKTDRAHAYERMKAGDPKYLQARDQGEVRKFARDYVDRRFTVLEFLLPFLIGTYILTITPASWAQQLGAALWAIILSAFAVDTTTMVAGLKREAKLRFPDDSRRGLGFYATMRATQIRRWRIPRPQVKRGQKI